MPEIGRLTDRRTLKRTPEPIPGEQKASGKRNIILTVAFLGIIAIAIVAGLYFSTWKDLWRPVITVNEETINMDYLIRRMKYVEKTDDILTMLYEVIPNEMLIRQGAPRYGIQVTPDELDGLLRDVARGENETISEIEFKSWYRNQLNETRFSDAEYREWVRTTTLAYRLNAYLTENISTVAEQIHLYIIVLPSYDDAEAAITRTEEGEDFSELARELSLDEETGEQGGDAGWWPEGGGLQTNLEWAAFDLEIGEVSDPMLIDSDEEIYVICIVTERQPAREIEEDKLEFLKGGALQEWLDIERGNSINSFSGMDWSELKQRYVFGSKTMAWISLQLAK